MNDDPKKGGEFPSEHQEAWASGYFWGQRSIVNTLLDDAKKELEATKLQVSEQKKEIKILKECLEREEENVNTLAKQQYDANRINRALYDLLLNRRAMEPKHSREDHECDECTVLANMEGFLPKPEKRKCVVCGSEAVEHEEPPRCRACWALDLKAKP